MRSASSGTTRPPDAGSKMPRDQVKNPMKMQPELRLDQPQRAHRLREVTTLGLILKRRAVDVLAYFDRPDTSNGPAEAINGRIEHLRDFALSSRHLTSSIARSLVE